MKASEVKVGGLYKAMVSNNLVTVRVDSIDKSERSGYARATTRYSCTNLKTGRSVTIKSAAKFRGLAYPDEVTNAEMKKTEGEKSADPTKMAAVAQSAAVPTIGITVPDPSGLLSKIKVHQDDSPHLIIEARAGTGKTTTLIEGLKRLKGVPSNHPAALNPSDQQRAIWECLELSKGKAQTVCFVAFNKSIASELQSRVPPGCQASTMHSMGFKAVRGAFGNVKVDEYRVDNIICELLKKDIWEIRKENPTLIKVVKDLVGLCKMNLVSGETKEELQDLVSHYDIEMEGLNGQVFELVPKVLDRCKEVKRDNSIDFDDMIWIPVTLKLPVTRYDMLLVDEAQDLNRCQQALAKVAGKRLILCGDPKQAIYGFAGADAESMNRMTNELRGSACINCSGQREVEGCSVCRYTGYRPGPDGKTCKVLPLTVTRRCGKAIVAEANKIVADFSAHESNGEGTISHAGFDRKVQGCYSTLASAGDMLLCRVNAPLVSECFRFIKEGRKANIQGRDVGQGLINTVKKLMKGDENGSVVTLVEKLSNWLNQENNKENAKRFPSESRLIALQDKHDCILCFTEGIQTVKEVIAKIESIFVDQKGTDRRDGILLSSIHKAKGLEANRVFLLEPEGASCPHPMATTAWQVEQEYNLRYVAITRAIKELVYVK